jgi:hypothetical protein
MIVDGIGYAFLAHGIGISRFGIKFLENIWSMINSFINIHDYIIARFINHQLQGHHSGY